MKVSPDGVFVAVEMRRPEVPADWAQSWVDIYGISEGKLLRTYEVSGLDWAPDGKSFVHIKDGHQGKQLWVTKIEGGDKLIVDGLKNLTGAWWMPDAKSLLYAIADEPEKDETGLKRLRGNTMRRQRCIRGLQRLQTRKASRISPRRLDALVRLRKDMKTGTSHLQRI